MTAPGETVWRERLSELPDGVSPSFELERQRTALLVIDMQYSGAHPDHELGLYYRARMPEVGERYYRRVWDIVVPNQQRLLTYFRSHNLRVIYLTVGSELEDGSDTMPLLRQRDSMIWEATRTRYSTWRGAPSREVLAEVAPREGELVINKTSKGAFNSSSIDQVLRNMGVEGLIMVGVATNACVESTGRDAADRGYKCVVVEDGCASNSTALHHAALLNFQHLFGQVRTTDETLAQLAGWDHGSVAEFQTTDLRPTRVEAQRTPAVV